MSPELWGVILLVVIILAIWQANRSKARQVRPRGRRRDWNPPEPQGPDGPDIEEPGDDH